MVFYFKGPGRNNRDPDTLELDETDEDVATLAMLASQDQLNMYILKLEEEANYFKSSSPEDEICSCKNCQVHYHGIEIRLAFNIFPRHFCKQQRAFLSRDWRPR